MILANNQPHSPDSAQKHRGAPELVKLGAAVEVRLAAWAKADIARRIWAQDPTVWIENQQKARQTPELSNRLGWLNLPELMQAELPHLAAFAQEIRGEKFTRAVLLGMGGSSLAPEVFMRVFGAAPGHPSLAVCDTTHPDGVRAVAEAGNPKTTLFIVSSKSGSTIETNMLFKYFYSAVSRVQPNAGRNFVAITDPGSKLQTLAAAAGFRRIFPGPNTVGGRYSALAAFGLVPAALIGVDLAKLLKRARAMMRGCHYSAPAQDNPGLQLGAAMGELAKAGFDKLTLIASPSISSFGAWVEQLVAESIGKDGKGILPVVDEASAKPEDYSPDRAFVYLRVEKDDNRELDAAVAALEAAGRPVLRFLLADPYDLGGEFYRWEMAAAAAGAALGINPFDQPNVELAKVKARALTTEYQKTGKLPERKPLATAGEIEIHGESGGGKLKLETAWKRLLKSARRGGYLALMAYLPYDAELNQVLGELRLELRRRTGMAVTLGYGPRFLHSTGQLHKGDANNGLFVQITADPLKDEAIPGESFSFSALIAAQAGGDYDALAERRRRLLRFHIHGGALVGLRRILDAARPAQP